MAPLLLPLVHCLLDQEPTAFHADDAQGRTFSFAVNLSIEIRAAGPVGPVEQAAEEAAARDQVAAFLSAVRTVDFHLYALDESNRQHLKLTYAGQVAAIPPPEPVGDPGDLLAWLAEQHARTPHRPGQRYWSTEDRGWSPEEASDADAASASDRLRAVQAWNAPVGHRFALTRVARVPRAAIAARRFVVLPRLALPDGAPAAPCLDAAHGYPPNAPGDLAAAALDCAYDLGAPLGKIVCRTNLIGEGLTRAFDPAEVVPGLDAEGYFAADAHAQGVHRLLAWFEARAASLLAAGAGLSSRGPDHDPAFEALFGLVPVATTDADGKAGTRFHWGGIVWFTAARLIATLDALVIAFLKPAGAASPHFDPAAEGEILAPLVSLLRQHLEAELAPFAPRVEALASAQITGAVRAAVAASSPLVAVEARPNAQVVRALRRVFAITPPAGPPGDARAFVSAILARYAEGGTTHLPDALQAYARVIGGRSVAAVTRALADLEQSVLGEAGAEAALVRLIEDAAGEGTPVASLLATGYLAAVGSPGDAALRAAVGRACDDAWRKYRALLDGDFDGAEAVRRAAGSAYVRVLLDGTRPGTPAALAEAVTGSAFTARRLLGRTGSQGPFDALIAPLVTPDPRALMLVPEGVGPAPGGGDARYQARLEAVRAHLDAAFAEAVAPILALDDPKARFVPDPAPRPLVLRIASTVDGRKFDEFGKHFNGIALAIRREDGGAVADRWAHAHLADLCWGEPVVRADASPEARRALATLHPMMPAVGDGRGPMFIEYHGFPFADPVLDARVVDGEGAPRDPRRPFYRQDTHDLDQQATFAPVPRLAYGRSFRTFGFVTSNAGTLPLALQHSDDAPWLPMAKVAEPGASAVGVVAYQRRTAIAQMAVTELGLGPRHIGAAIDGVAPLAADFPRVGFEAAADAPGVRDLFLEADGRGAMATTGEAEWRITGIAFSGQPASLRVRFFDRAALGPDDLGTEFVIDAVSVPGFDRATEITIRVAREAADASPRCRITVACGGTALPPRVLACADPLGGWLRFVLTSGSSAALSFAAPTARQADILPALLLLAPSSAPWRDALPRAVAATVSMPRVTYLDFERWLANADLYDDAFGAPPGPGAPGSALIGALLAAYLMRHLDPRLAARIDRLPDPAVTKIRLELTALDGLGTGPVDATAPLSHDVRGRLADLARDVAELDVEWTPANLLARVLEPLDALFTFEVRIAVGSSLTLRPGGAPFEAAVPPGTVARLSLDALVPARLFEDAGGHPSAMHVGLRQYAPRALDNHLAFPAAALHVETMYDGIGDIAPAELADAMISVAGIARTRRFDLMTAAAAPNPAADRHWRLLAEIDVTTQRWRPTGRPIYRYADPRAFRHDGAGPDMPVAHPALRLRLGNDGPTTGDDPLAQFEREAFFDRPDSDASTLTQRLAPLPARTKIQELHWDSPAATYFRHRFTLRSRYAGALALEQHREVAAWPGNSERGREAEHAPYGWTIRVAMLADGERVLLTRPQLRALIPLTTTPGGAADGRPPPVAAVLQEPPFARGGLADRIAAEIKTGFGYGFVNGGGHVEILDARKEGGPNPHLDYRPLRSEATLGLLLRAEGPIGLTFDAIDAPAPAFPNSMLALQPDTLAEQEPLSEEFFAGVALRRYLDPGWTTAADQRAEELGGDDSWWIDWPDGHVGGGDLLGYAVGGGSTRPLLTLAAGEWIEVRASKSAIDGVGATNQAYDAVAVMRVPARGFSGLAILHQVVAPGRYSASIFVAARSAGVERGAIDAPAILASFEWSPGKSGKTGGGPDRASQAVRLTAVGGRARPAMASAPTFLRWTKTGRDFDLVHIARPTGEGWGVARLPVRDLAATLDATHRRISFFPAGAEQAVWVCPSTFAYPQPQPLHRHLGLITSHFLKELGRPVELFGRTAALRGVGAALVAPDRASDGGGLYQPREHVVRIIEFETPAKILCGGSIPVPEDHRTAYFDLVSTGFMREEVRLFTALSLHFRIVGPTAQICRVKGVAVCLRAASASKAMRVAFDLGNNSVRFAVSFELKLRQAARGAGPAQPATVEVVLLRSDGSSGAAVHRIDDPLTLTKADNDAPGLFVSIEADSPAGEFWTDVSALHSTDRDSDALDFDWLFTPYRGAEPAAGVAAAGLVSMVEAQARVIAVSPPIPIVRH